MLLRQGEKSIIALVLHSLQRKCCLVNFLSLGLHMSLLSLHNLCHGYQDVHDDCMQALFSYTV